MAQFLRKFGESGHLGRDAEKMWQRKTSCEDLCSHVSVSSLDPSTWYTQKSHLAPLWLSWPVLLRADPRLACCFQRHLPAADDLQGNR
jgi:hypothetical protein